MSTLAQVVGYAVLLIGGLALAVALVWFALDFTFRRLGMVYDVALFLVARRKLGGRTHR